MYGPMKVNCHLIVGLGESDRTQKCFYVKIEQIAAYLFSFNPELGTVMETPRAPIARTRRIQLVKNLIEEQDLPESSIEFDESGTIRMIDVPREMFKSVTENGVAFMTDGCPDRKGKMACNRPYGSYRPGEEFRDYLFSRCIRFENNKQRNETQRDSQVGRKCLFELPVRLICTGRINQLQ